MTNEAATTENTTAVAAETPEKKASKKQAKATSKKASKVAAKKDAKPASKKESKASSKPAAKKEAKAAASVPREFSKKAIVLDLLRRKDGATMAEIAKATDWQAHYADVRIMPTCVGNPACGAGIAAMKSA